MPIQSSFCCSCCHRSNLLLSREKWDIPANIEFEYPGDPLVEVPKCLAFCQRALA